MAITIKEIAKLCGVSISTVSKVANGKDDDISYETKEKVRAMIKKHNYVANPIARSMVTKNTKTLGLLIPDISNPFFTDMAKGAEDEAQLRGYSLLLCNSYENFEKELSYINMLIRNRVSGILISGTHERFPEKEQELKMDIPIVAFDRTIFYPNIVTKVFSDNEEGAYQATKYLINKNFNEIGFLGGDKKNIINELRFQGYKRALEESNIRLRPELVLMNAFTLEAGIQMIQSISDLSKIEAFFCANDLIALGAQKELQESGYKIPEDISLIGVDNITLAQLSNPGLTTMNQKSYEMGRIACRNLIDYLEGKSFEEEIKFEQELIIRQSVI